MIGIIGAMDIEVEGLISAMSDKEERKISGIVFHSGKVGDKECVVAKCGIGKVNAAGMSSSTASSTTSRTTCALWEWT